MRFHSNEKMLLKSWSFFENSDFSYHQTPLLHIQPPISAGMAEKTSGMLTYDSINIPAFHKKTPKSRGQQPLIMFYPAIDHLVFLRPTKPQNSFCPALIIIQKSKSKAIATPKAHNPLMLSCRPSNVIPYFIRGEQQKIIMGISMSQSQEIRRLKLHDLQYKQRSLVRFHSSSPVQFRGIENQQVDNKAKPKQLITEPSFKARPQQPESRINQTLNYELDMDLQQVNPRAKAKGKGGQRLRQSNPVKENSYSEVLRISKAKEHHENQAHPQTMRSRKVKIGKK